MPQVFEEKMTKDELKEAVNISNWVMVLPWLGKMKSKNIFSRKKPYYLVETPKQVGKWNNLYYKAQTYVLHKRYIQK